MRALARFVSIAGHPIVLIPAALITARAPVRVLGLFVAAMLAAALYVVAGLRAGKWTDIDVSRREQRAGLYLACLLAVLGAAAAFALSGAPAWALRRPLVAAGLLVACGLVNLRLKASLHAAFAVYAAALVGPAHALPFSFFAVLSVLVAWSRIPLDRHTPLEAACGWGLGALAGGVLLTLDVASAA